MTKFLFLIEAIPTLITGAAILLFFPSLPFAASFLSPREKAIAQARLNRDHRPQSHGGMTGWSGFKAVVSDPNSWLFMLIYASSIVGVATISYFLPALIKPLGFSSINAQGMTVAPNLVGWCMVVFQALHSDRTRDRGCHIMGSCFVSFTGYIILVTSVQKSVGAAYFALFLVVGGNRSLFPLVKSWAVNTFSPTSKRGVVTVVSISNCVSMWVTLLTLAPMFAKMKGYAISAGCLLLSFLAALTLRTRLSRLNKLNERWWRFPKKRAGTSGEIWDNGPRYVFMA